MAHPTNPNDPIEPVKLLALLASFSKAASASPRLLSASSNMAFEATFVSLSQDPWHWQACRRVRPFGERQVQLRRN
jgi:hypothetical protein